MESKKFKPETEFEKNNIELINLISSLEYLDVNDNFDVKILHKDEPVPSAIKRTGTYGFFSGFMWPFAAINVITNAVVSSVSASSALLKIKDKFENTYSGEEDDQKEKKASK